MRILLLYLLLCFASTLHAQYYQTLARPTLKTMDASGQGSLFIIGAAGGVGKPYYVEGARWDAERAIPMAKVRDQVYQATLTVGEQLNPKYAEFGIYGNYATMQPQFMGRAGSEYRLTISNMQFDIGKGYLGHDDGVVYLRSTARLQEGDTYLLTVDLTRGVANGELTIEKVGYNGIESIRRAGGVPFRAISGELYNLQGQRLAKPLHHGIYILGKKKVVY
ncbi:MAG: DUF5121 domain-containing protein [Bacteroidaceae bacterium]|nr:DUF5121 domain-containing protein [Bacteroidaceae bacterium]